MELNRTRGLATAFHHRDDICCARARARRGNCPRAQDNSAAHAPLWPRQIGRPPGPIPARHRRTAAFLLFRSRHSPRSLLSPSTTGTRFGVTRAPAECKMSFFAARPLHRIESDNDLRWTRQGREDSACLARFSRRALTYSRFHPFVPKDRSYVVFILPRGARARLFRNTRIRDTSIARRGRVSSFRPARPRPRAQFPTLATVMTATAAATRPRIPT